MATLVREEGGAVSDKLVPYRVVTGCPSSIFSSTVQVNVELLTVPFQRSQALIRADQVEPPVNIDSRVGQAASSVSADATACQAVKPEIQVFIAKRPSDVGTRPASVSRNVSGSDGVRTGNRAAAAQRGRGCDLAAREHPVAEAAVNAEHFIMAEARLKRRLDDDVRGRIKRVVRQIGSSAGSTGARAGIVKTTTGALGTYEKIVSVIVA